MRSLPLLRYGPRARWTSYGIALCTMFVVASFSVVSGLGNSMDKLAGNFTSEYTLLVMPGQAGMSFFPVSVLEQVSGKVAPGVFSSEVAEPAGINITLFAVSDPHSVLKESFTVSGNDVLLGLGVPSADISAIGGVDVAVAGRFSSSMFSPLWTLGSMELVSQIAESGGEFNFAIARSITASEAALLQGVGFEAVKMVGIVDFLDSGVREIESDATWVLIPSAFVIAVLAYSFMGMEVSDRRHDIGIIKTIGAGRWKILYYLLAEAVLICMWGAVIGLALGIIVSYGISTVASVLFSSVFIVKATESLLLISFLATVGAGAVGAIFPALRMTVSRPVDDLKEVVPSY